ncbi:hypothetical protein DFH09DRAFT_1081142 [Mycena vulgaris]|nr:hypothetical protein DFH09DRAFT_1081142 [Mycena vulgaris]
MLPFISPATRVSSPGIPTFAGGYPLIGSDASYANALHHTLLSVLPKEGYPSGQFFENPASPAPNIDLFVDEHFIEDCPQPSPVLSGCLPKSASDVNGPPPEQLRRWSSSLDVDFRMPRVPLLSFELDEPEGALYTSSECEATIQDIEGILHLSMDLPAPTVYTGLASQYADVSDSPTDVQHTTPGELDPSAEEQGSSLMHADDIHDRDDFYYNTPAPSPSADREGSPYLPNASSKRRAGTRPSKVSGKRKTGSRNKKAVVAPPPRPAPAPSSTHSALKRKRDVEPDTELVMEYAEIPRASKRAKPVMEAAPSPPMPAMSRHTVHPRRVTRNSSPCYVEFEQGSSGCPTPHQDCENSDTDYEENDRGQNGSQSEGGSYCEVGDPEEILDQDPLVVLFLTGTLRPKANNRTCTLCRVTTKRPHDILRHCRRTDQHHKTFFAFYPELAHHPTILGEIRKAQTTVMCFTCERNYSRPDALKRHLDGFGVCTRKPQKRLLSSESLRSARFCWAPVTTSFSMVFEATGCLSFSRLGVCLYIPRRALSALKRIFPAKKDVVKTSPTNPLQFDIQRVELLPFLHHCLPALPLQSTNNIVWRKLEDCLPSTALLDVVSLPNSILGVSRYIGGSHATELLEQFTYRKKYLRVHGLRGSPTRIAIPPS